MTPIELKTVIIEKVGDIKITQKEAKEHKVLDMFQEVLFDVVDNKTMDLDKLTVTLEKLADTYRA